MRRLLIIASAMIALAGCREDDEVVLEAHVIENPHDLIGGPLGHGQIGDFLIQNDKVRFVITGAHHSWGPGLFGGTVVDADLRRDEPYFRGAEGNDHFGELFPTINLLVPDPTATEITVVKDGSDGQEAQIRVTGVGLMYLEALELLDPLGSSSFAPILRNLDVMTVFNFETTFTLRPGKRYLEIETVGRRPDHAVRNDKCADSLADCDLDCGGRYSTNLETGCLACACDETKDMELYTDTVPLLARIIGDSLAFPADNQVKPGLVGGDFIFFGGGTKVFAPGMGFDAKGAIFDNLFRGVDTITSPLEFDWLASVGEDVSYSVFTAHESVPDTCEFRVVVSKLSDPAKADELRTLVETEFGLHPSRTPTQVQNLVEQRLPLPLYFGLSEDDAKARLAQAETAFAGLAEVGLEPDGRCRDPKLLIPLFTSSATMVGAAGLSCSSSEDDDETCDNRREFRFKRYLAVGEGDVNSAMAPLMEVRGTQPGTIRGVVVESRFGQAQPRADVFALRDPDPTKTWDSYDELLAANVRDTARLGVLNQAKADVGTDPERTGRYKIMLPAGSWLLVARSEKGALGRPTRVNVTAGVDIKANLLVDPPAVLDYRVLQNTGGLVPSKLTLQALDDNGQVLRADGKRRVALGEGRLDDGIFKVVYSATGNGQVELESGRYRLTVSRGFEYSVDEVDLTLRAGEVTSVESLLVREVDTSGFIAADFHLHAEPSFDSGMDMSLRVVTNVVEGIELLSSSDHDSITDYAPTMRELGLDQWASSQVGLEVTTLELGHTLAFPLKYDGTIQPTHGAVDWVCKTNQEMWDEARALGEFGAKETIISIAHPRDGFFGYFDQFALNPWTAERGELGLESNNPLLKVLSCDFDTVELLNGKRFELVRTPTVGEINDAEACLAELNVALTNPDVRSACAFLTAPPTCETQERLRGEPCSWYADAKAGFESCDDADPIGVCKDKARNAVTLLSVRRFIYRTPEEQAAWQNATEDQRNPDKTECGPDIAATLPNGDALPDAQAEAPCAQHEGTVDDWFTLLNFGMHVAAMGNSDSHGTGLEPGSPRNYVASSTDDARHIDRREIAENLHKDRVVATTGPFVRFHIGDTDIGGTTSVPSGDIKARIQIQTASWFGVSRLEIYRNGQLEKAMDLDKPASEIVDFDETITLPRPTGDSWYVVTTVGLREQDFMGPVYHSVPLGELTFGKITSLAFGNLGPIAGIIGTSSQIPDYFPVLPYAITNPIFVDIDGGGYKPPLGDVPPFCPVACDNDTDCAVEGDVCHANSDVGLSGDGGHCGPVIIGQCGQGLAEQRAALTVEGADSLAPLARLRTREQAPRQRSLLKHSVGRQLFNGFVHGMHSHVDPNAADKH